VTPKGGTAAGRNAGRPAGEEPNGPTAEQAQRRDAIRPGACLFAHAAELLNTYLFAYNAYHTAYFAVRLNTYDNVNSAVLLDANR